MSLPIIVDCDPGNGIPGANVDDALALLYALRHPELECRAVWTVFGNTPSDTGAKCAQEIVDRAALSGQTPPHIQQGSTHPFPVRATGTLPLTRPWLRSCSAMLRMLHQPLRLHHQSRR